MKILLGSFLFIGLFIAATHSEGERISINYKDIGSKVDIIGRFGEPLGTIIKLDGVCQYKSEMGSRPIMSGYKVSKVNGKELKEPIAIRLPINSMIYGKRYVFIGYERGQMCGEPPEAQISGCPPTQLAGWGFCCDFLACKDVTNEKEAQGTR